MTGMVRRPEANRKLAGKNEIFVTFVLQNCEKLS